MFLAASPTPTPSPTGSGPFDWFALGPIDWVALGAIATFLTALAAVGIAIWGAWLRELVFKPKLVVSITMRPPDCMKMLAVLEKRPDYTGFTNSYQCRLRITNEGNREARNVQVKLRRLEIVANGGPGREDQTFIPMNLDDRIQQRQALVGLCHRS
jgi:hypothetical protein